MRAMRALIWKDCRLNRVILIFGAVLFVTPYVVAVVWALRTELRSPIPGSPMLHLALLGASFYSLGLSLLPVALLGGNLIASERADRSAEFLAYLPPSRAMIIASKAVVGLGTMLVIWGVNLLVLGFVLPEEGPDALGEFSEQFSIGLLGLAATGALLFGVGWLGSSFLESPTFAIVAGIGSPFILHMLLASSATWAGWPAFDDIAYWYCGSCLALGPLCFVLGTWYFVRRVEP